MSGGGRTSKTTDEYMSHFRNQTWALQGPEMTQAMLTNMEVHNAFTPDTMWSALPKVQECIIVGAGPSLKKNVKLLKGCGVPLIVTDRALPTVWEVVEPEEIYCVTNLESTSKVLWDIEKWWKGIPTEHLRLVIPTFCDPLLWRGIWKGKVSWVNVLFAHGDMNRMSERIQFASGSPGMTTGSNVGVMSFILAYNLGAKRIAFVGMDHCEPEPPSVSEMYLRVKDRNGEDAYLWWNFYIGQWELRYLSKLLVDEHKREIINCTEGGIIYDTWIQDKPLGEWLKNRVPIQEDETSIGLYVIDGDKVFYQKEVQ